MEPIWNQEMRDRALRIATSTNGTVADPMRLIALCEAVPALLQDVERLTSALGSAERWMHVERVPLANADEFEAASMLVHAALASVCK